ncbi:VOC family protein [Sinorhizobium sp. BG8]|uniref:VOC family protein n=1 Tax=Sinorhizobium sp. BG8 TaxID=2613773 RepID=UPI00193E5A89|nr:VOC family protein [Sinorhizobium sp. BG8]QRM55429.1 VOC family protein [Sinorhizobium sp. BG8]
MTVKPGTPRQIDHLVLPVVDLGVARERLVRLGFTVAPDARHPFGTENCCVFLSDGSYLEPLGIANREECEEAARKGNVFVARDQAFRFRRGQEGLSAIAMATSDAWSDDARYGEAGISGGEVLEFSRDMQLPDGRQATGSFRLAFAADLRSPDFFLFASERVVALPSDRTALETHPNGAKALVEVVLSETNPTDFQYLLQIAADEREVEAHSFGMSIDTPRGRVTVLNEDGMRGFYGIEEGKGDRGLKGRAVVLRVEDLASCRDVLKANNVMFMERSDRVLVPPAPGQGVLFVFGE